MSGDPQTEMQRSFAVLDELRRSVAEHEPQVVRVVVRPLLAEAVEEDEHRRLVPRARRRQVLQVVHEVAAAAVPNPDRPHRQPAPRRSMAAARRQQDDGGDDDEQPVGDPLRTANLTPCELT
jgi:hypothetical protein